MMKSITELVQARIWPVQVWAMRKSTTELVQGVCESAITQPQLGIMKQTSSLVSGIRSRVMKYTTGLVVMLPGAKLENTMGMVVML